MHAGLDGMVPAEPSGPVAESGVHSMLQLEGARGCVSMLQPEVRSYPVALLMRGKAERADLHKLIYHRGHCAVLRVHAALWCARTWGS
jgi:hypothetical protein